MPPSALAHNSFTSIECLAWNRFILQAPHLSFPPFSVVFFQPLVQEECCRLPRYADHELQTTGCITRTSERALVWQDVASDVSLYCLASVSVGTRGVRLQVAHVFWHNTSSALGPMVLWWHALFAEQSSAECLARRIERPNYRISEEPRRGGERTLNNKSCTDQGRIVVMKVRPTALETCRTFHGHRGCRNIRSLVAMLAECWLDALCRSNQHAVLASRASKILNPSNTLSNGLVNRQG